jgi:hypothetical protein
MEETPYGTSEIINDIYYSLYCDTCGKPWLWFGAMGEA